MRSVMPFLPGDSLLFIVGALCGAGLMSFGLAVPILLVAAILGDQCNFSIGRFFGPKVFKWENSRFFNRKAFDQAHGLSTIDYYKKSIKTLCNTTFTFYLGHGLATKSIL